MSDLIKRSDAIKIMACEMYAEAQSQGYEVDSIEDFMPEAKAWMNDAPSADRPQEWIPCSERLPEEKESVYLICTDYGYLCSCRWTQDLYGLGATKWSEWGWHRIDLPQYSKAVAWMDLKPWKGADDE